MVGFEAGPDSVESEAQTSQGTAEKHVDVMLEGSIREPIVDASNLNDCNDKPAKRCSVCVW
jgi:hypothetical protein